MRFKLRETKSQTKVVKTLEEDPAVNRKEDLHHHKYLKTPGNKYNRVEEEEHTPNQKSNL